MAVATTVTVNRTDPVVLGTGLGNFCIQSPYTLYVGGSAVDVADGFPVPGGVVFPLPIGLIGLEKLYGIAPASGTPSTFDVKVLKTSPL